MKSSIRESSTSFESLSSPVSTAAPGRDFDSLGIYARFPSPPPSQVDIPADILRFALQGEAAHLMPRERVAKCRRWVIPGLRSVKVMHSPGVAAGHYKNLLVCGSVWMCPVCASKITERRREELTLALAASDLTPMLITFTLRHQAGDRLDMLLKALMSAFDSFKSGQVWQKKRAAYGWIGSIRALEPTHGINGWHPHLHDLVLLESPLEGEKLADFTVFLKQRWSMVLARQGRDASWVNGVDVRPGRSDVGEYIAKYGRLPTVTGWSLEHELAKAPVKRGRDGGRSPYQLLADSMAGDEIASRLFVEYATVFKGKKQLVWSKKLRARLGLDDEEMTDEQLAAENREPAFVLLYLNLDQWKIVVGNDARAELLAVASHGDRERVCTWLAGLEIFVYDNAHFEALVPLDGGIGIGIGNEVPVL